MQKKITIFILSLFFIVTAENLERIAIFPFKTSGIQTDSSFIFVDSLRNYVRKSKQYEIMEYDAMKKILAYNGYEGDILCFDEECIFVMGEFLSLKKAVQGFIKKKRNTFSVNIRFIDLEKEETILDVTEHFKGNFEELLEVKVPKFAEMINWSTRYTNSVDNSKKNKKKQLLRNNRRNNSAVLRILFGITTLSAAGSGVAMNYFADEKKKEYSNIAQEYSEYQRKNPDDQSKYDSYNNRYEKARKEADLRMKARNVLYILAGTGVTFFSITFFF